MKVLIIEDETDFVSRIVDAFASESGATLLRPEDVGLTEEFNHGGGDSIEEQLKARVLAVVQEHNIDLVLLDTDLSRDIGLRTQTEFRQAFLEIGVPVCRYRKKAKQSQAQNLTLSRRLATDGATAIMVPHHLVTGDGPEIGLVKWLRSVDAGFAKLSASLRDSPKFLDDGLGPAGILAGILNRPGLHADLLGYTSQNSLFFGGTEGSGNSAESDIKLFSTRLGYWLVNYILAFPGPILHNASAAAYLNLTMPSFCKSEVQDAVKSTLYDGPFASLGSDHYWFENLAELVEQWGGDITCVPELAGLGLERVDSAPYGQAFYCLVNEKPIAASEAAPSPDWIPSGAQLTRIRQEDLDQLGPMLNI